MKRTDEENELIKIIKTFSDVQFAKKVTIVICVLGIGDAIYGVCNVPYFIYAVPILLPLVIGYAYVSYRISIDKFLKDDELYNNELNKKGTSNNNVSRHSQTHSQSKQTSAAANAVASYAVGKTVQQARKQEEIAKYGVRSKCCNIILSQSGREVTYQAKCDNCGKIVGRKKTVRLNPSQKYYDAHSSPSPYCPNCKAHMSVELQLIRK